MTEKPVVFIEHGTGYARVSKLGAVDILEHDPEYLVRWGRNSLEYHLRNLEEFAHRAEAGGKGWLLERLQEAIKDVRVLIDPASVLEGIDRQLQATAYRGRQSIWCNYLARTLGVHPGTLRRWRNRQQVPSPEHLLALIRQRKAIERMYEARLDS